MQQIKVYQYHTHSYYIQKSKFCWKNYKSLTEKIDVQNGNNDYEIKVLRNLDVYYVYIIYVCVFFF